MAVVCCLGMKKKLPHEGDFGVGLPGYLGYPGYPTCLCFLWSYIYSRLIILYIINLLYFYTETWRVTGVTEVTRVTELLTRLVGKVVYGACFGREAKSAI